MFDSKPFQAIVVTMLLICLSSCGGEIGPSYLSSGVSVVPTGAPPYQPVTTEYSHLGVNIDNALYMDSARFRIYYGDEYKQGDLNNLSIEREEDIQVALMYLEDAYEYFVVERGFRSPSLSTKDNYGPFLKLNIYATRKGTAQPGGYMNWSRKIGRGYIETWQGAVLRTRLIREPSVIIHEFAHSLTYSEYYWVEQSGASAWWEPVADGMAAEYLRSPEHQLFTLQNNLPNVKDEVDFDAVFVKSYLTIIDKQNLYTAWPFFTYLNSNPDDYPGLGNNIVQALFRNHPGNNETPLHTLARITAPVSVQHILGRYWARMAYLDVGLADDQARFFKALGDEQFIARAFDNWDYLGDDRYRVKPLKQPMYGGANITPIDFTDGRMQVTVTNLGNGLVDSNFTATLSIHNTLSGMIRYTELIEGEAEVEILEGEQATLVVVNTPDNLYQYNAFKSSELSKESIGLNYEVKIHKL